MDDTFARLSAGNVRRVPGFAPRPLPAEALAGIAQAFGGRLPPGYAAFLTTLGAVVWPVPVGPPDPGLSGLVAVPPDAFAPFGRAGSRVYGFALRPASRAEIRASADPYDPEDDAREQLALQREGHLAVGSVDVDGEGGIALAHPGAVCAFDVWLELAMDEAEDEARADARSSDDDDYDDDDYDDDDYR